MVGTECMLKLIEESICFQLPFQTSVYHPLHNPPIEQRVAHIVVASTLSCALL